MLILINCDILDFDYSLPFQYILPLGCPSSFEGPDGFVRYFTRVTLETTESKAVCLLVD